MKKNKSASQKKDRELKQHSRKNRNKINRVAMAALVVFILLVVVYSIKSIRHFNLADPGNRPFRGNGAARIIISEFSDFQCPACRGAEPNIGEILKQYQGKVKFVFYNYPLTQNHQFALIAAEAALCANDQEKFWPYHDLLYDRQDIWSKASDVNKTLKTYATELGLNGETFSQCLEGGKKKSVITEDQDVGDALQVQSTPTIFINQQRIIGGNSLTELKQALDSEINLRS